MLLCLQPPFFEQIHFGCTFTLGCKFATLCLQPQISTGIHFGCTFTLSRKACFIHGLPVKRESRIPRLCLQPPFPIGIHFGCTFTPFAKPATLCLQPPFSGESRSGCTFTWLHFHAQCASSIGNVHKWLGSVTAQERLNFEPFHSAQLRF